MAHDTCLLDLDLLFIEIARQQRFDGIYSFGLRQFCKQIAEISVGFQSIRFGRLDQRVQIGTGGDTLDRVTKQSLPSSR